MKRPIIFISVILAITFLWLQFGQDLNLASLQNGLGEFIAWREAHFWPLVFGFAAAYILIAAASLPIATLMTLLSGALFGFWGGLIVATLSATIGATLSFWASRYFLSDWVEEKFGDKMSAIHRGVARDGAIYLFTLRLLPIFPFFMINLLMGLTKMRSWTYFWVSLVGMLPGTAVYVNAGRQLSELQSLSGLLSPIMLFSFALLALFPFIARWIVDRVRAAKVYRNYKKPKQFDRNLVVIGAGAAGLISAYIGATVKAKVTLIEAHKMGGDCLNYGCIPSKALLKSAKIAAQVQHSADFGIVTNPPKIDFPKVMQTVNTAITKIEPHDSIERYTNMGVDVRQGYANLIDPWTVEIDGPDGKTQLTSRAIILATGAAPFIPPIPGLPSVSPLSSDTLWAHMSQLTDAPKRMLVLGGGPIGCELSQAFARLGTKVTLVEMAPRLLLREDPEVSTAALNALLADGVDVQLGHKATEFGNDPEKWVTLESAQGNKRVEFDEVLVAVGRQARLQGYGLEALGIESDRTLKTNEFLQTKYPNILAAGDVAGPYQLTHAAGHQAGFAAINGLLSGIWRLRLDERVMPAATFLDPEIARVGLNEIEAAEKGIAYEVTTYDLDDLDRAIADGVDHGFIKILTPPGKDKILGVSIVGANAGELLSEFTLAMKNKIGLKKIMNTIHIYPTMSDANKLVAGQWRKSHTNTKQLVWAERFFNWRRGQ